MNWKSELDVLIGPSRRGEAVLAVTLEVARFNLLLARVFDCAVDMPTLPFIEFRRPGLPHERKLYKTKVLPPVKLWSKRVSNI